MRNLSFTLTSFPVHNNDLYWCAFSTRDTLLSPIAIRKISLVFVILSISFYTQAQVGIGTTTPSDAAALHILANDKGLIIPIVDDLALVNTSYSSDTNTYGLMVYLKPERKFYSWNGTTWQCLNPIDAAQGTTNINVANTFDTLEGNFKGSFTGYGATPVGGIIMWSGNTIPQGWALCDGYWYNPDNNNEKALSRNTNCIIQTPNLRGKFIVGYDATTSSTPFIATNKEINYGRISNTGGYNGITLTTNQSGVGAHTHPYSGTTGTESNDHTHDVASYDGRTENNDGAGDRTDCARPGGSRTSSGRSASHTHSYSGTTSSYSSGALESHENRPPYYVLAFIMRVR